MSVPKILQGYRIIPLGVNGIIGNIENWQQDALIVSNGNRRNKNGVYVSGGPFYVRKASMSHGTGRTRLFLRGSTSSLVHTQGVQGVFYPYTHPVQVSYPSWTSQVQTLSGLYPTGYKKARPGNPVASAGQFLIELRDLPTIPFKNGFFRDGSLRGVPLTEVPVRLRQQLLNYRNLGSEYLNVVFGWMPFVSDLRKMYNLWQDIDKRIARLVRENGQAVRHRATVEDSTSTTQSSQASNSPYFGVLGAPPAWMTGNSLYSSVTRTTVKSWFVGSFRYYVPDIGSSEWTSRAKRALFGLSPTPELLWEVLPWSWLIDWFSNVGDVISNASSNAVDNLTLGYSFIMRHTTTEMTCSSHVTHGKGSQVYPFFDTWEGCDHMFSSTYKEEIKVRAGGMNPFGLNVQLSSLTNYQLGILGALGLSRGLVR